MAVAALGSSGRGQGSWWLILLLLLAHSNGRAQAAPTKTATVAGTTTTTAQQLQIGVEGDTPTLMATGRQQYVNTVTTAAAAAAKDAATTATEVQLVEITTVAPPATSRVAPTTTLAPPATSTAAPPATTVAPLTTTIAPPATSTVAPAATTVAPPATTNVTPATSTVAQPAVITTTATIAVVSNSSTELPATTPSSNTLSLHHQQPVELVVQLLDLEHTSPINNGHDGFKFTKKKQLQQQQFHTTTTTTTPSTTTVETEVERIPTTTTSRTTVESSQPAVLMPVPNGYLGPIFMGEKIFSVVHPAEKQQAMHHQQPLDSIESQLREGRLVEILAPTALLESSSTTSSTTTTTSTTSTTSRTTTTTTSKPQAVLSTTVFQVPEQLGASTTRLPMAAAEISVAAPPRTESKISDIQIEVYDSTVDSIVASTNFRDNQGYYPLPLEPALGTTKPPSSPVAQERFTQYVIDRADVSTQPADPGVGKPEPAAIEIHINVSEAFGNESEDLEFSYRQPPPGGESEQGKPSRINDEILVVEIIDSSAADNSTENVSSNVSSERLSLGPYRSDDRMMGVEPPAVRPPQPQDADELFMADRSGGSLPRPPHPPPPPPMPRKPNIDRDSDTIFYISNTEVKVGESLPTPASGVSEQQRKQQLENQFFPASYVMDQQRSSSATPRYEEDIILSPLHNTADALKILRSPGGVSGGGDGAPPLDVTYVGESVIEVEQQSFPSTSSPLNSMSSPQPDIIIQPAVLPDLAIGVPVIGELPPQIELKEIDYMPGELMGQGQGIYENDIESNSLGMGNDPDVMESSIQYGGDLIDDGAGGGFDGVEGSYPFDSPAHRLQQQQQPLGHRFSHLHREQQPVAELLNATFQQRNESGSDVGGASAMAPLQHGGNQLLELKAISVYPPKSDNPLADYFNLIAVSVGLIIVVLAAGLLTSMYCAVRYFLNKNATSSAAGDDSEQGQGQGQGQDSKHELSSHICSKSIGAASSPSTPASQLSHPADLNSNPNQNQNSNSNPNSNAALIRSMSLALAGGVQRIEFQFETRSDTQNTPNATASGTTTPTFAGAFAFSGSVTKMTLKDNHLIVVTEERHDISRNARETKMHTDKDGVFVVEVARGIDSKQPPDSPANGVDTTELPFDTMNAKQAAVVVEDRSLPPSHEQVQIHAPPSDFANPLLAQAAGGAVAITATATSATTATGLHLIEEEPLADEVVLPEEGLALRAQAATGLSQSDLSSTSSNDSNKRYSYGNQELYVFDQPGYVTNAPTVLSIPLIASEEVTEQEQEQQVQQLEKEPKKEQQVELEQSEKPKEEQQETLQKEPEEQVENQMEQQQKQQQKEQQIQQELEKESMEQQSKMQLSVEETSVPAPTEFGSVEENRDETKEDTNETTNEITNDQNKEETQTETKAEEAQQEPELNESNQTTAETDKTIEEEQCQERSLELEKEDPKVTEESQLNVDPENGYDSLMSLPAPPSTEEIRELSDFTLMESNQLDSLPPPPPPPISDNGHSHNDEDRELTSAKEAEKEAKTELIHSNGNGNGNGKAVDSNGVRTVAGGTEEPSTLTPPASPPASPTSGASLCGGSLSNGIHSVAVPMAVDVNGS